jgi:hypothetical protein
VVYTNAGIRIGRRYRRRIKACYCTANPVTPVSRINDRGHIAAWRPVHTGKIGCGCRCELFIDVHISRQDYAELIKNTVMNVTHVTPGWVRSVFISQWIQSIWPAHRKIPSGVPSQTSGAAEIYSHLDVVAGQTPKFAA